MDNDKSLDNLKRWAAGHIRWFGQSAFALRAESGATAFIDPYRVKPAEGPADLILVTHPHPDHYDRTAIEGLKSEGAVVVVPRSCAKDGQVPVSAGESRGFGPFTITGIAAYNIRKRFHPRSESWLGYVIQVDGLKIYHAGDSDLIPEMKGVRPDIALLPVGGMFAMNDRAAAEAADVLQASLCIPMHFGFFLGGRGAGARFVRRVGMRGLQLPRRPSAAIKQIANDALQG